MNQTYLVYTDPNLVVVWCGSDYKCVSVSDESMWCLSGVHLELAHVEHVVFDVGLKGKASFGCKWNQDVFLFKHQDSRASRCIWAMSEHDVPLMTWRHEVNDISYPVTYLLDGKMCQDTDSPCSDPGPQFPRSVPGSKRHGQVGMKRVCRWVRHVSCPRISNTRVPRHGTTRSIHKLDKEHHQDMYFMVWTYRQ